LALGTAVDRAVGDHDDLDFLARQAGGDDAANLVHVRDDLVPAVVDRHDDRQQRPRNGSSRSAGVTSWAT
jgi:hypothetical protein